MSTLLHQRCFNHSQREAAARCPECAHFYCRECITEHDDRVICSSCLKKFAQPPLTQRRGFVGVLRVIQFMAGVFMVWLFFYWIGQSLLSIESSFHEATIWQSKWLERE